MTEQRSRLQLLDDLRRLNAEHTGAPSDTAFEDVLASYSYGELQVIADFLTADIARLRSAESG